MSRANSAVARSPSSSRVSRIRATTARLKEAFGGPLIANEQFTLDTAQAALEDGSADAIAWGKLFIANPDLPRRLELGAPLNKPVPETFYAEGETGYTDYPALSDAA